MGNNTAQENERPLGDGQAPLLRHLPGCRNLTAKLRALAQTALTEKKPAAAFAHLSQILALSHNLRNKAPLASYLVGVEIEESALEGLDLWLAGDRPPAGLLRRVLAELNRHAAETPPPLDCLQTECFRAGGVLANPPRWRFYADRRLAHEIALSLEMPWEKERSTRLWQAVWAGLFRALLTPYGQLPQDHGELETERETTRIILQSWLPATEGPGSSLTAAHLARLLEASWLADEQLFAAVVPLRSAATRARWRVDACRLRVALGLYQLREAKPAQQLEDLVPNYLPELPVDPYSGRAFHYRISKGEQLEIAGDEAFQGRNGPEKGSVRPGQGILWSTGPDRVDHGGRKHGGRLRDEDQRWSGAGFDLVAMVPQWP